MDAFVWDQNFVTGLPQVDEQHHKLVDLFNELSQGLFSKRSDREVVLADTYAKTTLYMGSDTFEAHARIFRYPASICCRSENFVEQGQGRHLWREPGGVSRGAGIACLA